MILEGPIPDPDDLDAQFEMHDPNVKPVTNLEGVKVFEDSIIISKTRLKRCRRDAHGVIIKFKKAVQTIYGDDAEYALALNTAVMREPDIPLDIRMEASREVMDRVLGKPRQEHIVGASQDKVADELSRTTIDAVEAMGELPSPAS